MPESVPPSIGAFGSVSGHLIQLVARKVSLKYVALMVDWGLGFFMVPFNLGHLGQPLYGLWMLVASIPVYFSLLDLGYPAGVVKAAAHYRALGDSRTLNEVASTLFFFLAAIGLLVYSVAALLAFNLPSILRLSHDQAATARQVLLILSINVAIGFPCGVFGAIVKGSMDPYMTSIISVLTSLAVVLVNVAVLWSGHGIVPLVAAITAVRTASYLAYWRNARRVFPALRIRPSAVRRRRLRELTGFSLAMVAIDLGNKLNYATDMIVVGAFMNAAAVAGWAIAQRPVELIQRFALELSLAALPVVVSCAALERADRIRSIFLYGTQLSLALATVGGLCLMVLAHPLITLWVGGEFSGSVPVLWVLAVVVMIRIGCASATTVLEGAGRHWLLAVSMLATGVANLGLSILLVQRYGLIGVALGSLIPIGAVSLGVVFPAACRHIGVTVRRGFRVAVLPALWPALPAVGLLVIGRWWGGDSLAVVALHALAAAFVYVAIFFGVAISRGQRQWYWDNVARLCGRPALGAAS